MNAAKKPNNFKTPPGNNSAKSQSQDDSNHAIWISRKFTPLLRKAGTKVRQNIVWSTLATISTIWIATSYLVYLAEKDATGSNITSFSDAIWWGIVTMLTIGYGDRYPVTTLGREIASVLMLSGVACVGIITAKISSIFLEQALRNGRGIVDPKTLENHFVICGWSENMQELLKHILEFNHGLKGSEIVVIANVTQAMIDTITSQPDFADLHFIIGDHFNEMNLRRSAPDRAKKILILADRTPSVGGQLPTSTEVDARTIMTAMTIANVARGTLVTAEILDPKMDHYLKLASVTEIIYSSEYARLLLGNATSGTGIANIIFDLLSNNAGAHITSLPIDHTLVGKTYAEAKSAIETQHRSTLVIGVLENSGNTYSIKEMALRKAQQTPNMSQLVQNLQTVKGLRCNNPIFNPDGSYVMMEGSMVIVIAKQDQAKHNTLTSEASDYAQAA